MTEYALDAALDAQRKEIDVIYHRDPDSPWLSALPDWGERRAPGRLQDALAEVIKAHASLRRGVVELEDVVGGIQASLAILQAKHGVASHQIEVVVQRKEEIHDINVELKWMKSISNVINRLIHVSEFMYEAFSDSTPDVIGFSNDITGAIKALFTTLQGFSYVVFSLAETGLEDAVYVRGLDKENAAEWANWQLQVDDSRFEVQQMVKELETMESGVRIKVQELFVLTEALQQAAGRYRAALAEGERLLEELEQFRKNAAADIQDYRYQDMAFRIFRNDAVAKYRASFDLAARYAYLAATAYDYETNLLRSDRSAGSQFLTDIVRQRSLGVLMDDRPVAGPVGLADPLARLTQNFEVYRTQLGLNNPQAEASRFSLRYELFRIQSDPAKDEVWRRELQRHVVADLWDLPEFRRYCRPFAIDDGSAQPGIVVPFPTEVTFSYNLFGKPMGGGDGGYDPSHFATKIRAAGVWFTGYDDATLSRMPRVYLVPIGADVLRSPSGEGFATREWVVVDQKLPVPFPIGPDEVASPTWIAANDTLSEEFGGIRRHSSLRAYPDDGTYDASQMSTDSRLIGRSVWNTRWLLIIPAGTLLYDNDPADGHAGLERFIDAVTDIKLYFQTYAYSGN